MVKNKGFTSSSSSSRDQDFQNSSSGSASSRFTATAARDKVSDLGSTASHRIDGSPLMALGAGAALGAVLGAILPRSDKERELLAPIGAKLADAGTSAVDRARETGKQKFDEMAGDSVRQFFGTGSSESENSGKTA